MAIMVIASTFSPITIERMMEHSRIKVIKSPNCASRIFSALFF